MDASMRDRVAIVTGATSGIGTEIARGLATRGATVVLACRDLEKGKAVQAAISREAGNPRVDVLRLDLASMASVREFAREFVARYPRLDVLVNNAGVFTRHRHLTPDGLEEQFQVNYLGPFLLTNLLLDVLKASAPSRIVNVGSAAHKGGVIDFDDLQGAAMYTGFRAYSASKIALLLFTRELARRLDGSRVTVNCAHPGVIRTNLGRGEYPRAFELFRPMLKAPQRGAETPLYLATAPGLDGVTGRYFAKRAEARSDPASLDTAVARRLWDVSTRLAGINA